MKKVLEFRREETGAVRDVIRDATRLKLLDNAEKRFSYIKKRNITVHAYEPEVLDDLFANTAKEFLQDLDYLLKQLEKQTPNYDSTRK
jgi:Nucleotidyltransferase substrate binding protein like